MTSGHLLPTRAQTVHQSTDQGPSMAETNPDLWVPPGYRHGRGPEYEAQISDTAERAPP